MSGKESTSKPIVPFGKEFRRKYFCNLGPNITSVNHGSYGMVPQVIQEKFTEYMTKEYLFSDSYIRIQQPKDYRRALQQLAKLLNCDYQNLAIVDNATSGVNTILRSYPLEKGDKVVVQSTVYGACGNTVRFLEKRSGIVPLVVDLEYPVDDEDILAKFEAIFSKESPKMCMFDTVTSMPGVKFPFEKMTRLCKKYNVLSLIDGAHGVGLIPINLQFAPDFFVSNLHKWLFVPRGCAVLYVNEKHHRHIQTLPVSHSYVDDDANLSDEKKKDLLISKFTFTGTKSFSSIKCIEDAIGFRNEVCGGESAIQDYCNNLAIKVGETVAKILNTTVLKGKDNDYSTAMVNVEFPFDRLAEENGVGIRLQDLEKDPFYIDYCQFKMIEEYNTMVPTIIHNKKMFARFSCQVYNELSDYEYATDALIKSFVDFFQSDYCQTYSHVDFILNKLGEAI